MPILGDSRGPVRVRFWGTRGSIPTPGPSTVGFGGNTSCVSLVSASGELFVFDCGTGAYALANDLLAKTTGPIHANILITHTHWDHIQGFPFFGPAFIPGNVLAIHAPQEGNRTVHGVLSRQMEFTYFPVELRQMAATLSYHDLGEGEHDMGSAHVVTQYLHHPAVTIGYRVELDGVVIAYLTDHEPFSDTLWRADEEPGRIKSILHEGDRRHAWFMADADLVIHDAQYTPEELQTKKTWGHSSHEYVVELAAAAGVRRLALTHHDPRHDDRFVAEIERAAQELASRRNPNLQVFCAREGMEIPLLPERTRDRMSSSGTYPVLRTAARILVVDDDPVLLDLAATALRQYDHTVVQAKGGEDALRLADNEDFDLIVLDIAMPGIDGMEVLRSLRMKAKTASLPVLLLTGMNDEKSIRTGFDAGATDYLTKPFKIPQLAARVHACLSRAGR